MSDRSNQGFWRWLWRKFRPDTAALEAGGGEPAVSSEVRSVVDGGSLVLLHVGNGLVFKSNPTGALIWQGLADRRSPRRIAAELSKEFAVPREVVEKDVKQFIADLMSHGLLARGSV